MSRRSEEEKTKRFFGVSPSQRRLNGFQLYSVLVSYLEKSGLPVGDVGGV